MKLPCRIPLSACRAVRHELFESAVAWGIQIKALQRQHEETLRRVNLLDAKVAEARRAGRKTVTLMLRR